MLDQGATRSVVSKQIVDILNLPMESKNMRVITIESIKDGLRDVASFSLSDLGGEFTFPVSSALVGDILTLESDVPPTAADIEGFSHLEGVTFDELPDKSIGVLLSVEYAWSWTGGEFTFPVSSALVGDILTLESDVPPTAADIEGFSHLEGVTFDELPDKSIGVLLSVEYAWSWMG